LQNKKFQELMGLREDKAELVSKLFVLEKDKSAIELKLKYVEGQQKAQAAALKNLQGQLKDTEALLALATQNKERGYSDAEHAQGVELELMQALAREARLKVRLQELVTTLEQVTKNAEARLLEGREIVHDLNHTNSILAETVDRNNKKFQSKFKKMEHQMLVMVEKHTLQVQNLQQRIATLETPPTNSSENSINSVAV
jgi:chromosome segregation ATPase